MGNGIKIIVADDNRNLCQMLQNYLQDQEDLSIVGVAYNGLEAWELIQTKEPDLIILDVVMPNMDGLSVLERINARTTIKRPKIIMLTAFGQESLTHQAMIYSKTIRLGYSQQTYSFFNAGYVIRSYPVFFFGFSDRGDGGKRYQSSQ
ncbi:fragment of stage 0 sporulation protein A (part 1/2) [Candidatus Desulfosporosinus infrequens]|uniref:Stage 0 sporulation protein A homolog n=1 Tax=Candidatus Desulfosporosinus infrequens TaxID=2043169 RepID=A0A2U3LKV1_9FIRM|nr:fragment of stage 0 sporulation protein A (part 1/2) [Candidatus Desulfosporosinus infrequens]